MAHESDLLFVERSARIQALFKRAYRAWVEDLERKDWKGVPQANASGESLYQELVAPWRGQ